MAITTDFKVPIRAMISCNQSVSFILHIYCPEVNAQLKYFCDSESDHQYHYYRYNIELILLSSDMRKYIS